MTAEKDFPTFAITTPVLNKAGYIRETIESVINQKGDFYIDYFIVDGESTDGTVEILREYQEKIDSGSLQPRCRGLKFAWSGGKDKNMYDAVNRGFARVEGDYMAYINADDIYMPWAFSVAADVFRAYEDVQWLTTMYPMSVNERGQSISAPINYGFSSASFRRGMNIPNQGWFHSNWVQQDCVFWRRSLWEKAGGALSVEYRLAGDFELWSRFFDHAELPVVTSHLAAFRFADESQVGSGEQADNYAKEVLEIHRARGGRTYGALYSFIRLHLVSRFFALPLSRLWRGLFHGLGFLEKVQVISQTGNEKTWKREERYFLGARFPYV